MINKQKIVENLIDLSYSFMFTEEQLNSPFIWVCEKARILEWLYQNHSIIVSISYITDNKKEYKYKYTICDTSSHKVFTTTLLYDTPFAATDSAIEYIFEHVLVHRFKLTLIAPNNSKEILDIDCKNYTEFEKKIKTEYKNKISEFIIHEDKSITLKLEN